MAVDMFLRIGKLKGESKDQLHPQWIDVLAWSWGMSQSGSMHVGGGGGSGKVSIQDISVTKYVDTCSTTLMQVCTQGTHFEDAVLIVRKAGGDNPMRYVVMYMNKVLVTSISTGGSQGEESLTENVTLNFKDVAIEYTEQKETGAPGATHTYKWDIAGNKENMKFAPVDKTKALPAPAGRKR